MRRGPHDRGFTLIEVLIALAIVACALLGAMRAAALGTTNLEEMRRRLVAKWVAENLLAEQRALNAWPGAGVRRGSATQAGIAVAWREEVSAMPDPAFRRVDIRIYDPADDARVLARLTGFLVQPEGAR